MTSSTYSSLVLFACCSLADSAFCQGVFREHDGSAGSRLGIAGSGVGDIDHDGHDDYAVGAPYEKVGPNTVGVVRVHSGKTGQTLFQWSGTNDGDEFGWCIDAAGDVDGDGTPDVIVGGIADDTNGVNAGSARVYSGATGAVLYSYFGDKPWNLLGAFVRGMGDIDGDGYADFAIVNPRSYTELGVFPSATPGIVKLYSGKTGNELYKWVGNYGGDAFGSVTPIDDITGDGRPDIVIGSGFPANTTGYVNVYASEDGSQLYSLTGPYVGSNFGWNIESVGDVNGDGRGDFAVGAAGFDAVLAGFPVGGRVTIHSGTNGAVIRTILGGGATDIFGSWIANLGDTNGDGVSDLAIAASPYDVVTNSSRDAYVRVVSPATGATLHEFAVEGETQYDLVALCFDAGDVNDDGYADLMACSQAKADNGFESGEARVLWVSNKSCGEFQSYGTACSPPNGSSPTLTLTGCPTAGGYVTLAIQNGVPNGLAFLCFGASQTQIPVGAGCSWYLGSPLPLILPLPLSGFGPNQGSITVTGLIPIGSPTFTLHHQAIVIDPSAALGFTTTNAVKEIAN